MTSPVNLEIQLRELKTAKAEFEHQLRRYGDAAERAGGVLGVSEGDAHQLSKNLKQTNAEITIVEEKIRLMHSKG